MALKILYQQIYNGPYQKFYIGPLFLFVEDIVGEHWYAIMTHDAILNKVPMYSVGEGHPCRVTGIDLFEHGPVAIHYYGLVRGGYKARRLGFLERCINNIHPGYTLEEIARISDDGQANDG